MFRNSENVEKVEYISYKPDYIFNQNPGNGNPQEKSNIRFYVNSTDDVNPNDWYNAYLDIHFKINKLADGTNFINTAASPAADARGTLAGDAYSLINRIDVKFNTSDVISLTNINHCVNALNMLQFSGPYVDGPGTNSFTYPRISSINKPLEADTNYVEKSTLTLDGQIEESSILLNRYPFFDSFKDKLCPLGKMEFIVDIEKDDVLMWIQKDADTAANKGRVIITKFLLWVPKLKLTGQGKKNYYNKIINPEKWIFYKINYVVQVNTTEIEGTFNITNSISKPRYVILYALRSVKFTGNKQQNYNPFAYDNYNLGGNNVTCTKAQLIIGNDKYYPVQPLNPTNQLNTMFSKVINFAFNGNLLTGTFMKKKQYKNFYPLIIFDLTKQENLEANLSIDFNYALSNNVGEQYSWRAMISSKGEIIIDNIKGNAVININ